MRRLALAGLAVGAALALAACAQPLPGAQAAQPRSGACDAASVQDTLGRIGDAALLEAARARSGAASARLIAHDQMVTKEFNSSRLNLQLDAGGRVASAYCG